MRVRIKSRLLAEAHAALIKASAISPDVARARGYWTATSRAELRVLGFGHHQQRAPALVVPVFTVHGEVAFAQIRPDNPRKTKKGKPIKYETPAGARMVLDVHPAIRQQLGDPSVPLYVTEGVRKADAAVSHGLVCAGLLGVWNWRGNNGKGSVTILADWESVALKGRQVFVAFDSDVMTKPEVQQALRRFLSFLESRGATAKPIYLKPGPKGEKVGLDDFFAAGGTVEELQTLAADRLANRNEEGARKATGPYLISDHGYVLIKELKGGERLVPLTNFTAHIVIDIVEDDGLETTRQYQIEAQMGDATITFRVPAGEFPLMNWVSKYMGPRAILMAGTTIRDHTRVAIQMFSEARGIRTERVYAHTGWRKHDGKDVYLHAAGAIGADGPVAGVNVRLESPLDRFALPEAPTREQLLRDVTASTRILDIGPTQITLPVFAAIWRSVLAPTDVTIHLYGRSGAFKTELASLAQRHFGRTMSANNLPGSWQSTGNALEGCTFLAKDALFVIDDFVPTASDANRANREAERVVRSKANASGRARMKADTTLRPPKPPRAFLLSTGEDVPRGQSLRARMLNIEVAKGSIDAEKLTACQEDAAEGAYERVMTAFIQWLADRRKQILADLPGRTAALRDEIGREGQHRRTPVAVADLLIGLHYFLEFAQEIGVLDAASARRHAAAWRKTLVEVAEQQTDHVAEYDVAQRFVALLATALSSGRAHLTTPGGAPPEKSRIWGWHPNQNGELVSRGAQVGWLVQGTINLDFNAALATVKQLAKDTGEELASTAGAIRQRLDEAGLLSEKDTRGGAVRREVRKRLGGVRRNVVAMLASTVVPHAAEPPATTTTPVRRPLRAKCRMAPVAPSMEDAPDA